jgi:hypothetical protein
MAGSSIAVTITVSLLLGALFERMVISLDLLEQLLA